ncbi:MAG: PqqD family protein [Acidimicrobiia bacterium]|nr:PqqD family protein [Acidimicrobiia bacterium]
MSAESRLNPWVTHERLDDEVIAINLETGAYFAFSGVAADCWSLVVAGLDRAGAAAAIAERYGVDVERSRSDVSQFVTQLEAAGLIMGEADAGATPESVGLPTPNGPLAYTAPVVDSFEDLEDLLLLDPIHEVDEAGWPVAAAE